MTKINPETTKKLLEEIKTQKVEIVEVEGVKIKTCKGVFPPKSGVSRTSEKLHTILDSLKGLTVLDVGTGTGVQAIQAVLHGAEHVVAIDINPLAISCAQENVLLNNVQDKVTVIESDLFTVLKPDQKFDVVIANLPITDFLIEGIVESALYDPDYKLHKRFFSEVGNHLNKNAFIVMTHINFKGDKDFEEFENMVRTFGYAIDKYNEVEYLGYLWRTYRFK